MYCGPSRRELVLFGVRMDSSRPEGGNKGGDVSTLQRVTVTIVARDLRSGGGGLALGEARVTKVFFANGSVRVARRT